MRQALQAVADELRRLKNSGVKTVPVSDETIDVLRRVVAGQAKIASIVEEKLSVPERARLATGVGERSVVAVPETTSTPSMITERKPSFQPAINLPAQTTGAPIPTVAPTVVLGDGDKATRWAALRDLVTKDPTCCAHVRPGKKVVLGVGSLEAKIMFVGEAPGAEEEIQGEPFVGPAGQLLTKMIQAMGLRRDEVYIGNIMNWRPEMAGTPGREQVGNRPPTEAEMRYCLPYLRAQIEVVNPDVLVALGATAAQGLLGFGSFKALGDIRGKWHVFSEKPLMVTYHPSYILRNQSNRSKRMIWEDLLKVMERTNLPISDRQRNFFLDK